MDWQNRSSLHINEEIYRSEKKTADRNRTPAYFLHNAGTLLGDVEEALDLYFKLCSIGEHGGSFCDGGDPRRR